MSLDLGAAIRAAIIAETSISDGLSKWRREPAVFTRRPVPPDAALALAIVNPPAGMTDEDGLVSGRPVVVRDMIFYGRKAAPGDPADQTRVIEAMADRARELFHRKKFSVRPAGFSVIDIRVTGPIAAPVDDEVTVARMISLTVRLRRD